MELRLEIKERFFFVKEEIRNFLLLINKQQQILITAIVSMRNEVSSSRTCGLRTILRHRIYAILNINWFALCFGNLFL